MNQVGHESGGWDLRAGGICERAGHEKERTESCTRARGIRTRSDHIAPKSQLSCLMRVHRVSPHVYSAGGGGAPCVFTPLAAALASASVPQEDGPDAEWRRKGPTVQSHGCRHAPNRATPLRPPTSETLTLEPSPRAERRAALPARRATSPAKTLQSPGHGRASVGACVSNLTPSRLRSLFTTVNKGIFSPKVVSPSRLRAPRCAHRPHVRCAGVPYYSAYMEQN